MLTFYHHLRRMRYFFYFKFVPHRVSCSYYFEYIFTFWFIALLSELSFKCTVNILFIVKASKATSPLAKEFIIR